MGNLGWLAWLLPLLVFVAVVLGVRRSLRSLRHRLEQRQAVVPAHRNVWWRLLGLHGVQDEFNRLIGEVQDRDREGEAQFLKIDTALRNIEEAALILDESHQILMANPAFGRMFGVSRSVTGERLENLVRSAPLLDYLDLLGQEAKVGKKRMTLELGDGVLVLEVSGSRFPAEEGSSESLYLIVIQDVTQQSRLETVRRDFVANVSHELRTPLSIIKGYVETLLEGGDRIGGEDRARFLSKIAVNTERLNLLLEDLLALSRLESSRVALRPESVELNTFIRELASDFAEKMNPRQHQIELDLDPDVGEVELDPVKMAQVLENLIDNAFKYSPDQSRVVIETLLDGDFVKISIRDNGRGIPAEDLPHIFERFYRVDKGRSRIYGGTGLGLSIVKHILLLHRGEVVAESVPDKGTCITCRIPRRIAPEESLPEGQK